MDDSHMEPFITYLHIAKKQDPLRTQIEDHLDPSNAEATFAQSTRMQWFMNTI